MHFENLVIEKIKSLFDLILILSEINRYVVRGKLDDVFAALARKLQLTPDEIAAPELPFALPEQKVTNVFPLKRYDAEGVRLARDAPDSKTVLDLRDGKKVRVSIPEASNVDLIATVCGEDLEGNFQFALARPGKLVRTYLLGRWWIRDALKGEIARLPIVNATE